MQCAPYTHSLHVRGREGKGREGKGREGKGLERDVLNRMQRSGHARLVTHQHLLL